MKLISTCSLAAILAAPVAAQGILPYLPKDTLAAMSAPDLSMSMAEFQQMPLAKMWAEEDVQIFFADILAMAQEQMDEGLQQAKAMHEAGALPIDPAELLKLRVNGATIAMTKMALSESEDAPSYFQLPKFGVVVHLDFAQSAPTWNMLIQMGLGMMQAEAGDNLIRTDSKIGDIDIISIAPARARGIEMALNVAMVPNGILICTLEEDLKSIVTNMTNKTPELTTAPGFAAATKTLDPAGAEVQFYMAPDPMVDFVMSALRLAVEGQREFAMIDMDGVERAMQAMGMRNLGTMAMASSYVDGKCITKAIHAHGNGGTTASSTVDTSFLRWVPKDAVSFSAGTLNVASLYDTILKGLQAYDQKFAEQALGQLAQIEGQLGFTIRGDLFGSIGDHYISWSMPMGTISSAPEVAILVKINNQEKLVSALKNLTALTNGMVEIEEGEKRGVKSYQVQVNFDPSQGMGINPFDMLQPTFAFKDGYMVIGFSASDVKRVFKRMDRDDNPKGDIRGNKEYMAVAGTIPAGVNSLSFTDWKANFESMYQLATGVLAFVPMPEDVPIDMSLLPDSETMTQHLFASVTYTKTDSSGTQTVDVSPFGPEMMLMVGAVGGVAVGAALFLSTSGGF
ncbi:MAG TPA: hypothetical protein EYP98_08870 [Planctomycetes bacterium]|nr:hypothetical protein [Planctomycetota bacterium]